MHLRPDAAILYCVAVVLPADVPLLGCFALLPARSLSKPHSFSFNVFLQKIRDISL